MLRTQCLLLVHGGSATIPPHHCDGLGGHGPLPGGEGKTGKLPRVPAPQAPHPCSQPDSAGSQLLATRESEEEGWQQAGLQLWIWILG